MHRFKQIYAFIGDTSQSHSASLCVIEVSKGQKGEESKFHNLISFLDTLCLHSIVHI